MVCGVGCAAAILDDHTFEPAIIRLSHGGGNADIGCDTGEDQIVDLPCAQDQLQISGIEAALAGFVDDCLSLQRGELRNDVPPRLATDQDIAAGAAVADPGTNLLTAPANKRWRSS